MKKIYNFEKISDLLYCSGQPTEVQLQQLAGEGYHIIVNLGLLNTKYALPEEASTVETLGMQYFHIPVVFENPKLNELTDFIDFMNIHADEKTLVHCAANYRASAFMGLYLFSKSELTEEEMHEFIDDVWQPNTVWQAFIKDALAFLTKRIGNS